MSKTIIHTIIFNNTTPEVLYNLYLNAEEHGKIIGSPASISDREGALFSLHNGYITGRNLQLIKNKLIVQAWRTMGWDSNAPDSTFIMLFEANGNDTTVTATHVNVPDQHLESIDKGWHGHYWTPWRQYLAGEEITRPTM